MTGKVSWFVRRKGYGIILGDDEQEYFVHYENINTPEGEFKVLYKDEPVEFDVVPSEKHEKNAVNVEVLRKSPLRNRFATQEEEAR